MMAKREEYIQLEDEIQESRKLPYMITVEKTEGEKVFTRNTWGSKITYIRNNEGGFDVVDE